MSNVYLLDSLKIANDQRECTERKIQSMIENINSKDIEIKAKNKAYAELLVKTNGLEKQQSVMNSANKSLKEEKDDLLHKLQRYKRNIKLLQIRRETRSETEKENTSRDIQICRREIKRLSRDLEKAYQGHKSNDLNKMLIEDKENVNTNGIKGIIETFQKKEKMLEKERQELSLKAAGELNARLKLQDNLYKLETDFQKLQQSKTKIELKLNRLLLKVEKSQCR